MDYMLDAWKNVCILIFIYLFMSRLDLILSFQSSRSVAAVRSSFPYSEVSPLSCWECSSSALGTSSSGCFLVWVLAPCLSDSGDPSVAMLPVA